MKSHKDLEVWKAAMYVAPGSASEFDTQLEIAKLAGITSSNNIDLVSADLAAVSRMLQGLIRSVKAKPRD